VHPQAHEGFDLDNAEQRVLQAVHDFIQRDHYLLERDVNERSITHHLAIQLGRQFSNWDVDCEDNRNHDLTKQLRLPKKSSGFVPTTFTQQRCSLTSSFIAEEPI
jgi:protein-disulfide isomerase-like protein with CxxC motif